MHFKTAVQMRDLTSVKPAKIGMWDMLILQDTYNKKKEDEAYLKHQMQNMLRMRAFYEGQIKDHKKQKQDTHDAEVNERKQLNKNLERMNREKAAEDYGRFRYRSEIATRNHQEGQLLKLKKHLLTD